MLLIIQACGSDQTLTPQEFETDLPPMSLQEGYEDIRISLEPGSNSTFDVQLDQGVTLPFPGSGEFDGWSLSPDSEPTLSTKNLEGLTFYSTRENDEWQAINFLLNRFDEIEERFPSAGSNEIQAVIWGLMRQGGFSQSEINPGRISRSFSGAGEFTFSPGTAARISDYVERNYRGYESSEGDYYAVIAKSGNERVQILLTAGVYRTEITNLRSEAGLIVAWDINDSGQIVGGSILWEAGSAKTDLGSMFAVAINNHGVVAGNGSGQPRIWVASGGVRDLGSFNRGAEVTDINDDGMIAGESYIGLRFMRICMITRCPAGHGAILKERW